MATVILLIVVLALLVFVHELGHFLAAKWSDIDVEEFGLGLPPRIWGKKIGDTLYSLNWIPFGGFVRISGDDEDSTPGASTSRPGRGFKEKSFFTKTSVMAGGVIANAYLAFFFIAAAFWVGLPVSVKSFPDAPVRDSWVAIVGVVPDSPASEAGFVIPSRVSSIELGGENFDVTSSLDVQSQIQASGGSKITLYILEHDGGEKAYEIIPALHTYGTPPSIGVELDLIGIPSYGVIGALKQSFDLSGELIVSTATGIVNLIGGAFSGTASMESVSGPVGIAGILADARSAGLGPLLFIIALISMSLAVINFVPFPALDGGRFLFLLIEAVLRRPIKPSVSRTVNLVGFVLLLLLMVFVTYHDIARMW